VVKLVAREQLADLVLAGEIDHALVLAALHMLSLYEERSKVT
jgi:hypothetical protein